MASKINYIILPAEIKERTALHDNTDEKIIYPEIKIVQDTIIMPMLGSTLYKKILSLVEAGTINATINIWYRQLIDDYLADAISNFVLSELATTLNNQFYNKGVSTFRDEDSSQPNYQQLLQVRDKYKQQGEFYTMQCRKFIIKNTINYPEFTSIANGIDVTSPQNNIFTSSLYLGDESDNILDNGYSDARTRNPYDNYPTPYQQW